MGTAKLVTAIVAGLCALFIVLSPAAVAERPLRSPEVTHTGKGPTGYMVTFRYANPAAKAVKIKGEWCFARPSELPQIAATPDHPIVESQGLLPKDWRPGDFPLQRPNSTGPNFPVADMTKGKDDVWIYTTPLPSGTFTYAFYVDCTPPPPGTKPAPGQPQCRPISDPSNRPWNEQNVIHARGFNTVHTGPAREVSTFAKAGIPVTTNFVNGGRSWYVWRILLKDFLTRVAFQPPPYAAW